MSKKVDNVDKREVGGVVFVQELRLCGQNERQRSVFCPRRFNIFLTWMNCAVLGEVCAVLKSFLRQFEQ